MEAAHSPATPAPQKRRSRFLLVFGVLWPCFTLILEWRTRACASQYFDPLPTWTHLLLTGLVPLACWLARRNEDEGTTPAWQRAALGAAWVVASFYLLCFWGLTLLAGFGVVFSIMLLATGGSLMFFLLPLATLGPFWGWVSLWKANRRLGPAPDASVWNRQAPAWGALAALLLLPAAEMPLWLTRTAAVRYEKAPAPEKARWMSLLRTPGGESTLRGMAYGGPHAASSPGEWIMSGRTGVRGLDLGAPSLSQEAAQALYYRVHGRLFNDLPPPKKHSILEVESGRWLPSELTESFDWDDQRGGDVVGARIRGLRMESSRMDWHLDTPTRLGYGEWTLVFHNSRGNAQEARCQILLPPGGFVSRLTLWVNGEPREAAFSTQAKVKAAYREVVVRQRRDPVLVNMTGPDRVMCQCFPVPANGDMQIRIGITAPLADAGLRMPVFLERNFAVPDSSRHAVWVQSARDFTSSDPRPPVREVGQLTWRHDLSDNDLKDLVFRFPDDTPLPEAVWCADPWPQQGRPGYFSGAWRTVTDSAPKSLVVVVDTSLALRPRAGDISRAIATLAEKAPVTVLACADSGWEEIPWEKSAQEWSGATFLGGRNNAPALEQALNRARSSGGAVVWLHGPQPYEFEKHTGLEQIMERSVTPPVLHACALVRGPNRLLERLHRHRALQPSGRCANETELLSHMRRITGQTARRRLEIARQEAQPAGERVWDHLARLGVFQEVLAASQGPLPDPAPMSLLAASYQLVTPLSGAVVLETEEQYKRAGLEPVDPNSTPQIPRIIVPEPSRLLLLFLACSLMLCRRRRHSV